MKVDFKDVELEAEVIKGIQMNFLPNGYQTYDKGDYILTLPNGRKLFMRKEEFEELFDIID